MQKVTSQEAQAALNDVLDPELNISIVNLGLIYDVIVKENSVKIVMTLTTIGCPLFGLIEVEIKNKMQSLGFEPEQIVIELVFDPPWSMERMSEEAKATLGI